MQFAALAVLIATVVKLMDLVLMVKDGNVRGALVQLGSYAAGIAVVALFAQTAYAPTLEFGGVTLDAANFPTLMVIGIAVASAASLTHDGVRAVERRA